MEKKNLSDVEGALDAPSACICTDAPGELSPYLSYLSDVAESGEISDICYRAFADLLDSLTTKASIVSAWPILSALWPDELDMYSADLFPAQFVFDTIRCRVDLSVRIRQAAVMFKTQQCLKG